MLLKVSGPNFSQNFKKDQKLLGIVAKFDSNVKRI